MHNSLEFMTFVHVFRQNIILGLALSECTKKFCTDLENMALSRGIHNLMEMGCEYFPLNETFVFMAIFG